MSERILVQYEGTLAIAEVNVNPGGGKCPQCGCKTVSYHKGWMECDGECNFAIDAQSWKRLTGIDPVPNECQQP